MPGVYDSGFSALVEVSFESFRRLALGELRRSMALACGPGGPFWFEDLYRDEAGDFVLVRLPTQPARF
jgi:hypothetical protein